MLSHRTIILPPPFFSTFIWYIFFSLKIFYRRMLDVQCCISFKSPGKQISYPYTYVHSSLDFSHIGLHRVLSRVPCATQQVVNQLPVLLRVMYVQSIPVCPFIPPPISAKKCLYKERYLFVKKASSQCRRQKNVRFYPWVRKIPWGRKWQPTQVSSPGKSHGQRSPVGYSPWGCKRIRHDLATKQHIF